MNTQKACTLAILLCALLLIPAYAQLSNATIKGTVIDATAGALTNATVELTNSGTDETRKQSTSVQGTYLFTALSPGEYALKIQAPGFAAWSGQLTLRVSQEAVIDVTMQTATVQTSVEVKDVTPVITPESSSLSDVKEAVRLTSLPLQSRNFLNILNFSPGVVSNNFAGQGAGYTRVNGIPGGSIDYLVDGATASERYTNELQRLPQALPTIQEIKVNTSNTNAEYSRPGVVEVVTKSGTNGFHGQAFWLNQNDHLAAKAFHQASVPFLMRNEYGGNLGGPVLIPKLYNGRNKTFFFFDYEELHQRARAVESYIVPKPAWKQGDLSTYTDDVGNLIKVYDPLSTKMSNGTYVRTPFPGNKLPSSQLNAPGVKTAGFLPDPNLNVNYYDGQNWQNPNSSATDDRTLLTAKVDQMFGPNRLSGRYTYTDQHNFGAKYFLNPNDRLIGGHNAALSFTQVVTPTLINEIRGGLQRFHAYRGPKIIDPPITQTLGLPTYPGTVAWPGISFGDSWTSSGYFDGIDRDNPQDAPGLTWSMADNLSWTKGKHQFKFGVFFARNQVNTFETGQPGGSYNFSGAFTALMDPKAAAGGTYNQQVVNTGAGLADMLLGYTDWTGLNQYPRFYTRQANFGGYVQDNWKVSRSLTLNLGLRYDYWTPFQDKRSQATTLNLSAAGSPTVVYAGASPITKQGFPQSVSDAFVKAGMKFQSATEAGLPSDLWNMQKSNVSPRIGLAYKVGPRTVLRGAYGIYYWAMPLVQYHQNTRKNSPYSYSYNSNMDDNDSMAAELVYPIGGSNYMNQAVGARTFGKNFITPDALLISKGSGWGILPWDTNYKTQMAQEWNFTVEHELPWRLGTRVSYIGSHGSNLVEYDPINVPVPRLLAPAGASAAQRRAYPDYASSSTGSMDLLRFNGYSNSHNLQMEAKRNFANGFVMQAFYTFQKTLATTEGANASFDNLEMLPGGLTKNASDAARLQGIYARDGGLPTHNFSANATYELPFGHGKRWAANANGFIDRLIGGWGMSGFYYWRSGLWFAPYYSVRGSSTILGPATNGILPKEQRQAARWFDPRISRADLGQTYNGEPFIRRANSLENDFLNNVPRNYMSGPGFYNLDSSFWKVTRITEQVSFRIEAQIFNLMNHKNFGLPNTAGVINGGVGTARLAQFQARIDF